MNDKQSLPATTWGAILIVLFGAYHICEALQGHTMQSHGFTIESWQVGGIGIGLIALAFYLWRLGIKRMKKNGEPINNDVGSKITFRKKKKHKMNV